MSEFVFNYKNQEKKTKSFNFRMSESLHRRLNKLAEEGKIKSVGDLINKLLENYLEELDKEEKIEG